jgi:hypothetical protein
MVEEIGELELGDGLLEEKLREPDENGECVELSLWLPLYRVWGQVSYKEGGSPDRGVMSLREGGLANLACKQRCLMVQVWSWLSSWSCVHVAAWRDVVLQCHSWRHCWHVGVLPAVLRDVVFVVPHVIISWSSRGVVQEWLATSSPLIVLLPMELVASIPG